MAEHQCPCGHVCASRVPIFRDLDPHELARFNDFLVTRDYGDGEIIYTEGSAARNLYIVNTGRVKLFKTSPDGREQVLRILRAGDFFGEAVLFGESPLSSSAQALGKTRICQLDKREIEQSIERNPALAHKLIAALSQRLQQAENLIEHLGTRSTLQRVAGLLVSLAEEQGKNTVSLPLSREGLAALTGMTFETFSRKLSELQQQGLILPEGRKKIKLLNLPALQELS